MCAFLYFTAFVTTETMLYMRRLQQVQGKMELMYKLILVQRNTELHALFFHNTYFPSSFEDPSYLFINLLLVFFLESKFYEGKDLSQLFSTHPPNLT